jgi:hypothetical protein
VLPTLLIIRPTPFPLREPFPALRRFLAAVLLDCCLVVLVGCCFVVLPDRWLLPLPLRELDVGERRLLVAPPRDGIRPFALLRLALPLPLARRREAAGARPLELRALLRLVPDEA